MHAGIEFDLPYGSNLTNLINKITEQYPEVTDLLRSSAGNLIIVDGVEVGNLSGLETPLSEDSEVVLVPVTHGG